MRKSVKWTLILLAVAGAAWFGYSKLKPKQRAQDFRAVEVTVGDIVVSVQSTGNIQPENRLEVKPPVSGRVERLLVHEGDHVNKGRVIAYLSSTERAALLDAARSKGPEEVAHWEELYKPTLLLAPMSGQVIERSVEPGQTVGSSDPVVVLSDRLIVMVQVDETDIGKVKSGMKAAVTLDAYPDQLLDARVRRIRYEAKTVNNVTMYEVVVVTSKTPSFMRSGMTANVTFRVASREGVLTVPSEAVKTRGGESFVLMRGEEGERPRRIPVTTGLTDGTTTEIVEGLSEGDTVMVASFTGSFAGNGDSTGGNPFMPQRPGRNRSSGSRSGSRSAR